MRRPDADLRPAGAISGAAIPRPVRRRERLTRGSPEPTNNGRGRPTLRPLPPWWRVFATNTDGTSGHHRGARRAAGKREPSRGPTDAVILASGMSAMPTLTRRLRPKHVRGATSTQKGESNYDRLHRRRGRPTNRTRRRSRLQVRIHRHAANGCGGPPPHDPLLTRFGAVSLGPARAQPCRLAEPNI